MIYNIAFSDLLGEKIDVPSMMLTEQCPDKQ